MKIPIIFSDKIVYDFMSKSYFLGFKCLNSINPLLINERAYNLGL